MATMLNIYALPKVDAERKDWAKARVLGKSVVPGIVSVAICPESGLPLDGFMQNDGDALPGKFEIPDNYKVIAVREQPPVKQVKRVDITTGEETVEEVTPDPIIRLSIVPVNG